MKMQIAMDYDQHNDLNNNNKNTYNDLQHTTHKTKELAQQGSIDPVCVDNKYQQGSVDPVCVDNKYP
jgi:hypothetical protein